HALASLPVTMSRVTSPKSKAESRKPISARRLIQHRAELVQLAREVVGMIPHKKATVVRLVGVRDAADDLVVEILDRFVSRKTAARDHPKFDTGAAPRLHDPAAIEVELGIQNERE